MCKDWRKCPKTTFRSLLPHLGLRSNQNTESRLAAGLWSSGWLYGWKFEARALFISHLCVILAPNVDGERWLHSCLQWFQPLYNGRKWGCIIYFYFTSMGKAQKQYACIVRVKVYLHLLPWEHIKVENSSLELLVHLWVICSVPILQLWSRLQSDVFPACTCSQT